jgi:hypothetical protein
LVSGYTGNAHDDYEKAAELYKKFCDLKNKTKYKKL